MCGKSRLLPTSHGFLAFLASPPTWQDFSSRPTLAPVTSRHGREKAPPHFGGEFALLGAWFLVTKGDLYRWLGGNYGGWSCIQGRNLAPRLVCRARLHFFVLHFPESSWEPDGFGQTFQYFPCAKSRCFFAPGPGLKRIKQVLLEATQQRILKSKIRF